MRDEIAGWGAENIDIAVNLLEPAEVTELELGEEATLCRARGIDLIAFPIAARCVPQSLSRTIDLARLLAGKINEQKAVAVHCRAGIGRSAVMAACVMVVLGTDPGTALGAISAARGLKVLTPTNSMTGFTNFGKLCERADANLQL